MSDATKLPKKQINSPLAKYNAAGQLTCVLCNQVVKSELLWTAHVNSKSHLDKKNELKSKLNPPVAAVTTPKTATPTPTSTLMPPPPPPPPQAPVISSGNFKRPASVLREEDNLDEVRKQKLDNVVKKTKKIDLNKLIEEEENNAQSDDAVSLVSSRIMVEHQVVLETPKRPPVEEVVTVARATSSTGTKLPEGFFDDPDVDAKMRGVTKRADQLEAEYEEFKRVMQVEEQKADLLTENTDTVRHLDRELEEVDELIHRWSKIERLHQLHEKRKQQHQQKQPAKKKVEENVGNEDDDDIDIDSVLNITLRNKKL